MTTLELDTPTRLDADSNGMLMTPEEFDAIEDYDPQHRYELVHGVVIVNPAPGPAERSPNDVLGFWIRQFQASDPRGHVIDETLPEQYIRTDAGWRRADRAIWVGLGRAPDVQRDVPTIAIEFVAPRLRDRRRDLVEKRREYAAAGVREYWVVDRSRNRLVVFRGPEEELILTDGVYRTDLLSGFELSIPALVSICNRYT